MLKTNGDTPGTAERLYLLPYTEVDIDGYKMLASV